MAVAALRATPEAVAPGGYAIAGVAMRGVVSAVPPRRITNDKFIAQFGDKAVADVVKMVGVETRYWVEGDTTAGDLCQAAAERLLEKLGWARDSVDALIFVSQTPDHRLPATSCILHGKLDFAPQCQARAYMEWIGNWYLTYRTQAEFMEIAHSAGIGEQHCRITQLADGACLLLSTRRG